MVGHPSHIKRKHLLQLVYGLLLLLGVNVVGYFIYTRFDLTAEKRYTLSEATKTMLKKTDDIIYFKVYLEGEFPAEFKRLKNEVKEMLDEYAAYSSHIQYTFIDPSQGKNKELVDALYKELAQKGIAPSEIRVDNQAGSTQKLIFPGAIVTYKGKEIPVSFLLSQMGVQPEVVLNNSIEGLEYVLSDAIKKLIEPEKDKIAFLTGVGEPTGIYLASAKQELSRYYQVQDVALNEQLSSLLAFTTENGKPKVSIKYTTLVIIKPTLSFSEKNKYIIDQYIMHGGTVLWSIDPVFASIDSLQNAPQTYSFSMNLNLEDQLFKYGVRLNQNLVRDLFAMPIPAPVGSSGGELKYGLLPWDYSPMVTVVSKHPLVRNLNSIKTQFISTLDTVRNPSIKKTILLTTSQYAKLVNVPNEINLEILYEKPDERSYVNSFEPLGVLLEGEFQSVFKNRIPPQLAENRTIGFVDKVKTKMIVISDGDIFTNQLQTMNGQLVPLPLELDKFTRQTFGNKDLLLNAVNYLNDDAGLIEVRSRELKIRLLDKTKIKQDKLFWQLVNILLPLFLLLVFGVLYHWYRSKKYGKK